MVLDDDGAEEALQRIVAEAPWLIEATWTPITKNQSLKLFARRFAKYYGEEYGQEVVLAIDHSRKRPDFTLVNVSRKIHVVEIKAAGHAFGNRDWDRLHNYLEAFDSFSELNAELMADFPDGWVVDLICDSVKIRDRDKRAAYEHWQQKNRIKTSTWEDFLKRAVTANQEFLDAQDEVREQALTIADERSSGMNAVSLFSNCGSRGTSGSRPPASSSRDLGTRRETPRGCQCSTTPTLFPCRATLG